jgi:kumamolisin
MKRLARPLLAALFAAGAVKAAPVPTMTQHVPASVADGSALRVGAPPATQTLELSISLPLRDEPGLRALIHDLYDPGSQSFRHYLSVAEFTARFGPTAADYETLLNFAAAHHLRARQSAANRRLLDVQAGVGDVESAFHIRLGLYRKRGETRTFLAPDREPTADLAVPILHITGLDDEIPPQSHLVRDRGGTPRRSAGTGSGPEGNFIGSDIRAAYYGGTALTGAGQSVGLLEYRGYEIADVQNYFTQVNQPLTVPIVGVSLNGSNLNCKGHCDDGEQALDIEEAISMAPGLAELVVYVGHNDVSILNQMAVDDTSRQLSSSWGWKADPATLDPIFEEFAAQGQTFVDATGDDGYHLLRDAVWPGDDQNVTGVGGTDLTTAGPGGAWSREVGWRYSGGGPSPDGILIPAYQTPFITHANNGSRKLRNVPDIAGDADTDNYSCYDGGCSTGNGGTSYAAPLWAGFIALVNQQAAASGKHPVGFLNPIIYTIGDEWNYKRVFHDEKAGENGRYVAARGFDLVTGFGSPAGQPLIDALVRGNERGDTHHFRGDPAHILKVVSVPHSDAPGHGTRMNADGASRLADGG